jgi:transposase
MSFVWGPRQLGPPASQHASGRRKTPRTLLRVHRIGMEACAGAHFLGRALCEQGHDVRLMPAQYVKPYVKTNKSDYIDAEAVAEAVERPNMRFVPIKTEEQLDLQAVHRERERWVRRRTAVVNQIRGLLPEHGLTLPKGRQHVEQRLPDTRRHRTVRRRGASVSLAARKS